MMEMNERPFEITMEFEGIFLNAIVEHKYSDTKKELVSIYLLKLKHLIIFKIKNEFFYAYLIY